jgi:hypothetical protein
MSQVELQSEFPAAVADSTHVFLMPTSAVAAGYGVGDSTIRNHKRDRPEELLEGQHWLRNEQGNVLWTARGVVQLGFCTQSKKGAEFRLKVENFLMQGNGATVSNRDAPKTLPSSPNLSTLDATAAAIADVVVSQLSAEQMLQERVNHHVQTKLDAQVTAVDAARLGESLALHWGLASMAGLTEAIANLTQPGVQA